MISISFSDVLTIPEFKGLNEVMLLHPSMDSKVIPYLWEMGLNYKKGYEVVAFKHRNLQNDVVIGYMYSGEIRTDNEFRNSKMCSSIDRVIMSAKRDFSLTKELCTMLGGGLHYGKFQEVEDDDADGTQYLAKDLYEEDYIEVKNQLATLRDVAYNIRGSQYNESGSLKTLEEYIVDLD